MLDCRTIFAWVLYLPVYLKAGVMGAISSTNGSRYKKRDPLFGGPLVKIKPSTIRREGLG